MFTNFESNNALISILTNLVSAKILNMNEKGKSKRATVVMIIAVVLILVLAGGAMFFHSRSLVPSSYIIFPTVALGFIFSYLLKGVAFKISGNRNFLINYLFQGVFLSALFSFLILSGNFSIAGTGHHTEEVTVERLYTKTQYKTRRVGRRYVGRGEPYKVYYMEIVFPDGKKKEVHIGQKGFGRNKKGEKFKLEIENGLFGIPVIKTDIYKLIKTT